MMPAGGGGYARAGTPDQDREWFPVRLTAASGTTTAGKVEFVGYEVWNDPTGATVEVVGGRVLSASQPGVFLGDAPGPYADAVPMLAQARLGPGSGGRAWELLGPDDDPTAASGSASGGSAPGSGTLGYICLGPLTTVAGCDEDGGLVVTTKYVTITATIENGRIRFTSSESEEPCGGV